MKSDKKGKPFKAEASDNDVVPYVPINGTYDKGINTHAGSTWN